MKTETEVLRENAGLIALTELLSVRSKNGFIILAALALGFTIWTIPPPAPLGANGMYFLATMIVAVALWILDILDEYIVGLLLLLSWVALAIVPSKVALSGFSENSWFFTIGALGIAAALGKTRILPRLSLRLMSWIPVDRQRTYSLVLLISGLFSGPLLPTGKARVAIATPLSQALAEAAGFQPRSNGSAAIALAAFIGFGQMSFVFLTAGEMNLIGWNFLPLELKANFGWLSWLIATLPAAAVVSLFLFLAIQFLLPLSPSERKNIQAIEHQQGKSDGKGFDRKEWITIATLILTIAGWISTSWHGINEAWVALAGLMIFLLTGVLDKSGFKNDVDWGLILFFGVLNSIATVATHLKVDAWFNTIGKPFLDGFSSNPLSFLLAVFVLVSLARFILRKTASAAFFALTLLPLSQSVGIHPGVMLITVLMAGECFLLGYQDGPYQIAYAGGGGTAFSHRQARKILAAKYLATLLAIAISIPYWRWFGFIG